MAHFEARLDVDTAYGGIYVRDMRWRDPYVILSERGYLTIFDMTDPADITSQSRTAINANYTPQALLVDPDDSHHVYLVDTNARRIYSYDITDPTAPVLDDSLILGSIAGSFLSDLAKQGDYVYIAGYFTAGPITCNIGIVNVSDPASLSEEAAFVDAVNLAGTPTGVLVDPTGTYLFVATSTRFSVFTFSGATLVFNNGIAISGSGSDYARMAQTSNGYVYIKDFANDRLHIIDARDPTAVSEVATFTDATYLNGVRGIQIVENFLYAMNFYGGTYYVTVYNINSRAAPVRVESLNVTADDPWGEATGRMGSFVVDPYLNLYVGRYTTNTAKGVASYGVAAKTDGLYVELAGREIQTQAFAVRITRGRESELKAAGTGVAEITVDNKDGDYSPENAAGAYYGALDLGNQIYVYEVYDGVQYDLFTGTIEKVVPSDTPDDATAFILATDGLDDLAVDPIDTVLRTSVKGGVLVGDILDAVPAFAGARDIDTGVTTFDVAYLAALTARAALLMLDDQERSFHYIDVDGDFQWEDRHHRLKAPHLTSQYDFEDEHIRLAYEWSKRELYNQVRITGTKYTSDPDTEYLWGVEAGVSGTALFIPAGGTATIWATFNQVLASFTAFVQGTHWNTNTVLDKTGVDTSDDVTVAVTQYGKALKIVFTSTSALNSYLVVPDSPPTGSDANRSAIVMGKLYQEDQVLHIEDDATSQTAYKTKALPITAPFKSDPDELRVMAEWLVSLHKDPAPRSVVASFHARANWPTNAILKQMLGRRISDRITLKSTRLGVDQDFYIDKVVHDWQQHEGLFNLKVDWTLSRASDLGGAFWILEEAGYGELSETTVLGF